MDDSDPTTPTEPVRWAAEQLLAALSAHGIAAILDVRRVDAASALRRLTQDLPVVEHPANRIRGLMRLFTSDVEDQGWYHDREFWQEYLTGAANSGGSSARERRPPRPRWRARAARASGG
jgi:hypothetical protein